MFSIVWCFVFICGLGGGCGLCCIRGGVFWEMVEGWWDERRGPWGFSGMCSEGGVVMWSWLGLLGI